MAAPTLVSPLAPSVIINPEPVEGVRFASGAAGIKYQGRTDVTLVIFDAGTTCAGVYTTSKCPSAAIDWCRARIGDGRARALVVNSGNANAFTGRKGVSAVERTAALAAAATGADPSEIFLASTGVIGEPLDAERFEGVLPRLSAAVKPEGIGEAAKAIMTTDSFPKVSSAQAQLDAVPVTISGIAKGAGMVAPDMATMLSFVFTDAPIAGPVLQAILSQSVQRSFNAITIDSDTSTNDTLMLFATGAARKRGAPVIESEADPRLGAFTAALDRVLLDLAHQVVRDGEGARKFIQVTVDGAENDVAAKRIALSIANSPLVKTAVGGQDANWGRIVMAVGKAGERADRDGMSIFFGPFRVAQNGQRDPAYDEAQVSDYMTGAEIAIRTDVGIGAGSATVWTCDLTKTYVEVNSDYRS